MLTFTLARRAATGALFAALAGCSGIHAYKQTAPDNMLITTDVKSGSATMHIYEMKDPCNSEYQGTVDLPDSDKTKLGIPAGKPVALEFVFYGRSFFTGGHSISYDTYLTPRAGYHYEIQVSYIDKMYSATVYEYDTHGGRHKVPRVEPQCNSREKQ